MDEVNGASGEGRVGVGVVVLLVKEGGAAPQLVLVGRRRSSSGYSKFALPGGHLEFGESWEECAAREVLEETGLVIHNIQFAGVTNSVTVNEHRPVHYVVIYMQAELTDPSQEPQKLEPEKCDGWEWAEWPSVPQPVFEPFQDFINSGYKLKQGKVQLYGNRKAKGQLMTQFSSLASKSPMTVSRNNSFSFVTKMLMPISPASQPTYTLKRSAKIQRNSFALTLTSLSPSMCSSGGYASF